MEGENSGMDISVGEKVAPETIDCNEVTSKLVNASGDTSEAVDDNDEVAEPSSEQKGEVAKKKKKKNKSKKKKEPPQQTDPPSIPVIELFPSGEFPEGEIQQYKDDNLWRETSEEKRELERLQNSSPDR